MRQIVESLKRLMQNEKIESAKIEALYRDGKLNMSEKKYILKKD